MSDDEPGAGISHRDHYHRRTVRQSPTPHALLPDGDNGRACDSTSTVTWKDRLQHFTWTFFTMTMATGGIANTLRAGWDPDPHFPAQES